MKTVDKTEANSHYRQTTHCTVGKIFQIGIYSIWNIFTNSVYFS